jgi:hypothetical protein
MRASGTSGLANGSAITGSDLRFAGDAASAAAAARARWSRRRFRYQIRIERPIDTRMTTMKTTRPIKLLVGAEVRGPHVVSTGQARGSDEPSRQKKPSSHGFIVMVSGQ